MPGDKTRGKPTTRRYTDQEKAQAVRLVRQLRQELGTDHGTIQRVARQLGYGVESVRSWVRQADIDDGVTAGTTTAEAERIKALEQEVRELRRANAILKSASAFFAAELDRPPADHQVYRPAQERVRGRADLHGATGCRCADRPDNVLRDEDPAALGSINSGRDGHRGNPAGA
jgi:transposase